METRTRTHVYVNVALSRLAWSCRSELWSVVIHWKILLDEIAVCGANNFACSYTFVRSTVCRLLSVRRLSHSCTLLRPFHGISCHLASTLAWSSDTLCWMGVPDPAGKEDIEPCSQNLHLPTYDSPGGSTDQRFRCYRITSTTSWYMLRI